MSVPDLLPVEEALARVLDGVQPLEVQVLPLASATGHCLAQPLIAKLTQPPFAASAMDGFAVCAADIVPGKAMGVEGVSQAGQGFSGALTSGHAVRIFTGAPLPEGADAVVMQEDARRDGGQVIFDAPAARGQNIRWAGNDFSIDQVLFTEGRRLGPGAIALAAASGHAQLEVYKKPNVALLATGDELVPPGAMPGPNQIVASNGAGLHALLGPLTARFEDLGIVGDDETDIRARLQAMLEGDADVILTTGGASVGDHDLVQPVLASLGVEMGFWRIAMRPGKPLMFGRRGRKCVFGLPGNPVSALVTAQLFVAPLLRALGGDATPGPKTLRLPLGAPLPANGARRHFMRGTLIHGTKGSVVMPVRQTDSAHLSSFGDAEVLIVHREHVAPLAAGEIVEVIPLAG